MKEMTGPQIIALASVLSIELTRGKDLEDMIVMLEFFGLVRHNIEIIKAQCILHKIERLP